MSKNDVTVNGLSEEHNPRQMAKLNRRSLLAGAAAIAIATPFSQRATAAGTPKHGGRLRQALRGGATTDSLNSAALIDTHNINVSWQVRNNLTEINAAGELVGELAESWENSPDAAKWIFRLKKGVEFHNGKSLEAQDVVDSINNHRGADSKSGAKSLLESVIDLQVDGKNAVVFTLREGNVDFPWVLSDYHIVIAPAGITASEWDKGIGTGPFVLTEWQPGVRAVTKRNLNYFKQGMPYFDEVETLNIQDQTARENALITGQVDTIEEPNLKTLHLLQKSGSIRLGEGVSGSHIVFPMLVDRPPFNNNDVRLAMKHACNRQALLDTLFMGHGYVGNDHPIGRNVPFFNSDLPQRTYDLDKAKFHLKKAGLSNLKLTLSAANAAFPGAVDSALLLREQMAPAGIDISVTQEPDDGYWSNVWMVKEWCTGHWIGRPTVDSMYSIAYLSTAAWNETRWNNARVDELIKLGRAELDENRRREFYFELQELTRDQGGALIPVFRNYVCAHSDKIGRSETIGSNLAMDGNKNTERWWFTQ